MTELIWEGKYKDGKKAPRTRQIPLPEGTYESVPYHNRSYEYIVKP